MKKLFFLLVAIMVATVSYSQSGLLATLSHQGEIQTFYGANALRQAHAAAANGDIITLSSGTFNSVDISKGITIRGAGMALNKENHTEPTTISGIFAINIPSYINDRLVLEGIRMSDLYFDIPLESPSFIKCYINCLVGRRDGAINNATFLHCICKGMNNYSGSFSLTASFINSVVYFGLTSCDFSNCIILPYGSHEIESCTIKNCIVAPRNYAEDIRGNTVYNCVLLFYENLDHPFYGIDNNTNTFIKSTNGLDLFSTYHCFSDEYNDEETFELTEAAKTKYLGLDGTQVGIYGGNMPFDSTPTNPQITKCNVAVKSTADGKLSVDIEVRAAE